MRFTQGLHRAVQQRPDQVATIFADRKRTFRELQQRVSRLAGGLRQQGIHKGDRVAMLGLNSDHYLEYYLAVAWAGCVVNPVNFRWSLPEIIYALNDSESVALFVDEHFSAHIEALLDGCPYLRCLIFCGEGPCPEYAKELENLISTADPIEDADVGGDELFGVFYTGGTTGTPKGVMLSHQNIYTSALGFIAEGPFRDGAVGLHVAPMFHLADMMLVTCLLLTGGTHVMLPAFKPELVFKAIEAHRVTDTLLVPAMLQMLVDHPGFKDHDLGSLRNLLYGASPASESLLDRAMQALPSVSFCQGYGMTEVAAVASLLPHSQHLAAGRAKGRLRSAGRGACHVQLRVVDGRDRELPRGEIGEVLVRGPNVMLGYLNKPEETQAALKGGWMHTGDMATMDEEGYITIVDRLKDMIISGAENIYSVEVENAIAKHPAVAACAVIGTPSQEWGEQVHAVIVLKQGASLTQEELYEHCKVLIAGYKCPRSMEISEALPLSGAGKVLKTELRKPYWEGRDKAVN